MRSQIILLLASMLAMTPPASAGLFENVRPNIMGLVAKDSGAKSGARDIIQKQFELSPAPERIAATDELLKKIQAASDSGFGQIEIALGSQQPQRPGRRPVQAVPGDEGPQPGTISG